jgi:hypothetical protein
MQWGATLHIVSVQPAYREIIAKLQRGNAPSVAYIVTTSTGMLISDVPSSRSTGANPTESGGPSSTVY